MNMQELFDKEGYCHCCNKKKIPLIDPDNYSWEFYEMEKSYWPPEHLPQSSDEDLKYFNLCKERMALRFSLEKLLSQPWMESVPSPPQKPIPKHFVAIKAVINTLLCKHNRDRPRL